MFELSYEELSLEEILTVLDNVAFGRLGVVQKNQPYIVPMWFCYQMKDRSLTFQMKSGLEGRKMKCLRANDHVCLEFDHNTPRGVESVIVFGTIVLEEQCLRDGTIAITVRAEQVTGRRHFFCICKR